MNKRNRLIDTEDRLMVVGWVGELCKNVALSLGPGGQSLPKGECWTHINPAWMWPTSAGDLLSFSVRPGARCTFSMASLVTSVTSLA